MIQRQTNAYREGRVKKLTGEFAIAVHAIVYLNHKKIVLSSEALAENVCTNPARIRKVMAKLKKAGLVKTKEGMDGGYHLNGEASEINLKQISDALEMVMVSASWKSGNPDMKCLVASGMSGIMDSIYEKMNAACQKELEQITIGQIDSRIFKERTEL